jgi:CRP-like cAMP-binding protein
MALADDIAVLSHAPLFSLMEHDALRLIAFAGEGVSLSAGELLFRRGERSDGGYVVLQGAVALDGRDDGSPGALVAGPGWLLGRSALFTRGARPASAVAREPSSVLRISPTLMRRVLEEFPAAARALHREVASELSTLSAGLETVRRRLEAIDEPR